MARGPQDRGQMREPYHRLDPVLLAGGALESRPCRPAPTTRPDGDRSLA